MNDDAERIARQYPAMPGYEFGANYDGPDDAEVERTTDEIVSEFAPTDPPESE